jgi:flagellar basal-body rod protein FlgG
MIRGLYTAATGMFALERRQATLANNLANVQTPGFKKDDSQLRAFPNLLLSRVQNYKASGNSTSETVGKAIPVGVPIGVLTTGVYAQERVPNFSQGQLVETNQPLDIAINDENIPAQNINGKLVKPAAFFAVQLPNGTVGYTRYGKFDLDANNNLVTPEGYRLLGADHRPLQINEEISMGNFSVTADGQLMANAKDPANTRVAGQIGMVVVDNPWELTRLGGNVYRSTNPIPFIQDAGQGNPGFSLQQGYVEQSNVDATQTMSDMMTTVRNYTANQKVISAYDESLQKLNSTGSINQ